MKTNRLWVALPALLWNVAGDAVASPNLMPRAGFDTGVYRQWRCAYQSGGVVDNADLDAAVRRDGPFSLRLRAYEQGYANRPMDMAAESAFRVDLPPNPRAYTLSAWVRGDAPLDFSLACGNVAIRAQLNPADGWTRLSATGKLHGTQAVRLAVRSDRRVPGTLHGGQAWVDSIQLEEGTTATDWQPSRAVEAGLVATPPFGIFHAGEPVRVSFRLAAPPSPRRELRLTPRLHDAFGAAYPVPEVVLACGGDPGPLYAEHVFTFPSNRLGVFRLEVEIANGDAWGLAAGERRLELPFYVLPRADPDGWNPIGLYAQMNQPTIELASRLNLFWNNLLSSAGEMTEWHKLWRNGELWMDKYTHRLQWAAGNHRMRFIGNIGPSSMLERLPREVQSETAIPGQTLAISHSPMTVERHHIRLDALRDYLTGAARAYRPYVALWQVVDECTFPNEPYQRLCVETARALRQGNPEAQVLATYPEHMAYTYVRAGRESCHGLYDLGRTPEAAERAVTAASLGGPDYPICFYDCSIPFNYLSGTFNGWGKNACRATAPAETDAQREAYLTNFMARLDETLSRQIHPLGVAGRHAKALCLYHVRMPGGQANCGTDAWGHPAPLLVACGIFNALTPGGSVGPIPLRDLQAYVFSRGNGQGHLIAIHGREGGQPLDLAIPSDLGVRPLDVWGNDISAPAPDGTTAARISATLWSYLTVPAGKIDAVTAWLSERVGKKVEPEPLAWPKPERVPVDRDRDGLVLHLTNTAALPLTLPDSDALACGNAGLTVACWIRPDTASARWAGFVKKDARAPGQTYGPAAYMPFVGWNLGTMGSGSQPLAFTNNSLRFSVKGPDGEGRVTAGPLSRYVETGKWTHVAATYNPDTADRGLRLYVNGVPVADNVLVKLPRWIDNAGPLTVGRDLTPFEGALDSVRVYARPLSDLDIAELFKREAPGPGAATAVPEPWLE